MSREQQTKAAGLKSLGAFIEKFDDKESALIEVLHEAQHVFGYLSKDIMLFISDRLHVPASKIYGVVSFYSFFTTEPKGRNQIRLCLGTACFVSGAERIAKEFEQQLDLKVGKTTADRKFSLEALRCVGACGLAPVALVNEAVYGKVTVDDVSKIIRDCGD
ncbi:MAG: NAD(P)H-dependent oxidoreductase subunit E [Deltaproteobacteria bacterium]|jgi:NADH-quinone oxidoreductase subunit E|nr:NAD(P)H-dependent oxidoreductase subunit E [Deltaproteobacteria bacterium]